MFVFDVNHQNAKFSWEDSALSTPNFIAENPANGYCHFYYVLKTAIYAHGMAKMKLICYAKAIYHAMNKRLNGDLVFTGLISHNPLHEQWRTMFLHTNTYSLDELAADLDLPTADELEKRKKYQELLEDHKIAFVLSQFSTFFVMTKRMQKLKTCIHSQVRCLFAQFGMPAALNFILIRTLLA